MNVFTGLLMTYVGVIFPGAFFVAYFERKLAADIQARVGPNRAGWRGILQPLADGIKLLRKDSTVRGRPGERVWFSVYLMALYSTVAVLPLGSGALFLDTQLSALFPFWAALVQALGTMLLGLSQSSVPGWFGGMRLAAQAASGLFPALIAVLCVGLEAGGFRWSDIVASQGPQPWSWLALRSPFLFVEFCVFFCAGVVLLAVRPLDGGFSRSDLHGGVEAELSGQRLILFRLGRYYGFFFWCTMASALFLGGWSLPVELEGGSWERAAAEAALVLAKTFGLIFFASFLAAVLPRVRLDHITDFAWRVLSPLALGGLLGSVILMGWKVLS